jgi:hypothetical protein
MARSISEGRALYLWFASLDTTLPRNSLAMNMALVVPENEKALPNVISVTTEPSDLRRTVVHLQNSTMSLRSFRERMVNW